ncbi:hypothetical protein [Shewanella maritima]|uniref:hypothetical protein n=1 Tax=Shewanella maritima TaxID=2520507 RepID=UPI00373658E3
MDRRLLLLIACFISFSPFAEVYKCADGKYQDHPCDNDSHPIDLSEVGSVITPQLVTDDELEQTNSNAQQAKREEISTYIRKQQINRKISQLQRSRKRALVEQELKRLNEERNLAQNGRITNGIATRYVADEDWQQSLTQEMSALNLRTEAEVASIDRQVEVFQRQLEKLESLERPFE